MPLAPPAETRPPKETHALDPEVVRAWLTTEVPGAGGGGSLIIRKFRGGQSNPTYWLGLEGGEGGDRELVLRKKPPGNLLPSAHAVEREHQVLAALFRAGLPVPEPFALETDPALIGTPFYVMAHVAGRIFWDPTLPELSSPAHRRALYLDYVRVLARLHAVDVEAVGLGSYGKKGGFIARQVDRWSRQYEASRTADIPAMEALMRWLRAHVPESDETTLIHGDYRLDNLVVSLEDPPRIVAVLDWELSTLGHPVTDLAYACMGYHLNLPGRGGLAGADLEALGIPSESELVEVYCEATGRRAIEGWPTFMAFGIFRIAAIAQGVYKRSLEGNASADDASRYGDAVGVLAALACSIAGIAPR